MPAVIGLCDQFLPQLCSGRNFESELRPTVATCSISTSGSTTDLRRTLCDLVETVGTMCDHVSTMCGHAMTRCDHVGTMWKCMETTLKYLETIWERMERTKTA